MKVILLVATALFLGTGCGASFFLVGAKLQRAPPTAFRAAWKITGCRTTSGQIVAPPLATYYVDDSAFYEMGANGAGIRIVNTWSDVQGRYFFTRVKTSHAWMYFVPADVSVAPTRYVYPAGRYQVEESAGVMKPAGNADATCTMAPLKS